MLIGIFRKNYQDPSKDEGFSEIVGVNFVPEFKNEEHKKLYHQFLVA
jgi:bifunctional polynucleotide phosphatase/kinase